MNEKRSQGAAAAFRELADRTRIVLVGPLYGGNAGAVARSMNNFGFSRLRLVAPRADIHGEEARRMAMYSGHILDEAGVFDTLGDALGDIDLAVGTTRRKGRKRSRYFSPDTMAPDLAATGGGKNVALIFGPEDAGLANEHLELCDWLVTIDTYSDFDSLNLAHSVTVILYEISRYFRVIPPDALKESQHLEGLYTHLEKMLRSSGFIENAADPRRVMLGLRRMIGRAGWSRAEIDLFHAVLRSLEKSGDE